MIRIRKSHERGHVAQGWLESYHSFSFADYYDPKHMGFRSLRVINEDHVDAGTGFGTHPHRDMEIVTYMLNGAIEHRDSMGNGSTIRAGDVQRMTAGTGVLHSEKSPAGPDDAYLLQIWIEPEERGLTPGYEEKKFREEDKRGRLLPIATRDGANGSVTIHQDAAIHASVLAPGEQVEHPLRSGRHAWVQLVSGAVEVNGTKLSAGDAAAISDESAVRIRGDGERSELLLFDLA